MTKHDLIAPRRLSSDQSKKLLYRLVPHNGGAVFAEDGRARLIAQLHEAIETAHTWGEFSRKLPTSEYQKIITEQFGEEGEPPPSDDDLFSGDEIGGYSDGDYPPWLQSEMDRFLPRDLLEKFGVLSLSALNGSFWHVPEEQMEPMANELRELGFEVVKAQDLHFH